MPASNGLRLGTQLVNDAPRQPTGQLEIRSPTGLTPIPYDFSPN